MAELNLKTGTIVTLAANSLSRNRHALSTISSFDKGCNRMISIRPASESANLGTINTFAEPVKIIVRPNERFYIGQMKGCVRHNHLYNRSIHLASVFSAFVFLL